MGLDISPGNFSVGYFGYRAFCDFISKLTGIFPPIEYYYDGPKITEEESRNINIPMGEWGNITPQTALHPLIWHSDCDGKIMNKHLIPLLDMLKYVLRVLIPALRRETANASSYPSYSYLLILGLDKCTEEYITKNEDLLKELIEACEIAIDSGKDLKFS